MILVDSSVWIGHFREADPELTKVLDDDQVVTHPFVVGELAMGNLPQRVVLLRRLVRLHGAVIASDTEVLQFIEHERLFGLGLGYIDVHLLASTRLTPDARLWSRDRRLADVAQRLGIAWP